MQGRILIVDDEESILSLYERLLRANGHEVVTSRDGETAWQLFQSRPFDLVLTDLKMPGSINGTQLTTLIKTKSPLTDVIIMTGIPSLESAIPALRDSVSDYLIKPFDLKTLLGSVRHCFEQRGVAQALLRKSALAKESVLAIVNHELRTPLTAVLVAVDLLKANLGQSHGDKLLCAMLEERIMAWKDIIEEITLHSDLQTMARPIPMLDMDVEELIHNLVDYCKPRWISKDLRITIDVKPGAQTLCVNSSLCQAMLKHLLMNAIQFNRHGGIITIETHVTKDHAVLSFSDTGIGIAPEKVPNVFDSFYQTADYLTRDVGGLGLGLSIVQRIAELHGGSVCIDSHPGEGTTVVVTLPHSRHSLQTIVSGDAMHSPLPLQRAA